MEPGKGKEGKLCSHDRAGRSLFIQTPVSWGWAKFPGPPKNLFWSVAHFFFFFLLVCFILACFPLLFFPCSIPFMWSEAAGLLCFTESCLRSCWRLEGREWQGSGRQWNRKVESFLLFESFWEMFIFLGFFYPWNLLSPSEIELASISAKKAMTFFASACCMESVPPRSSWSTEKL